MESIVEYNQETRKHYNSYDIYPVVRIKTIEREEIQRNRLKQEVLNFRRELLNNSSRSGEVLHGKTIRSVPNKKIKPLSSELVSAYCAPSDCIKSVHSIIKSRTHDKKDVSQMTPIDGITNWQDRYDHSYGIVVSLYEKDSDKRFIGDPVADALAVVTRRNYSILVLADGVSWGEKSKLASNCGVYGSLSYLCDKIKECTCTKEVFRCILRSFENAQRCIMEQEGTMTTLCVGVVVPLQEKNRYAFCVVNVGDSYAYIYRKDGVIEVTHGSHPIDEERDMRYCGGALGPADGYNPDLGNLTCSYVVIEDGDIVFLASDGVTDNFDPAVAKFTPRFKADEQTKINKTVIHQNKNKNQDDTSKNFNDFTAVDGDVYSPLSPLENVHTAYQNSSSCDNNRIQSVPSIEIDKDTEAKYPSKRLIHANSKLCDCVASKNDLKTAKLKLMNNSSIDSSSSRLSNSPIDHEISCQSNEQTSSSHESLNAASSPFIDHLSYSSNEEDNASEGIDEYNNDEVDSNLEFRTGKEKDHLEFVGADISFKKSLVSTNITFSVDVTKQNGNENDAYEKCNEAEFTGAKNIDSLCQSLQADTKRTNIADNKNKIRINPSLKLSSSDHDIQSRQINSILNERKEVVKCKSHDNLDAIISKDTFQSFVSATKRPELQATTIDLGKIAVQTLTPRERHKGALEQMAQVIKGVDTAPIKTTIHAVDVCAQLMNFIVNRTAEKRDILEEVPQSKLNQFTSKERKEHQDKLKKRLEDVPGKLDHASIVAYEVGTHGKATLKVDQLQDRSLRSNYLDSEKLPMSDARRQSEPVNKMNCPQYDGMNIALTILK